MSTPAEPEWLSSLREAVQGKAQPGVEVVRGARPALLDAEGTGALSSTLLAAFLIAAAIFRSQIAVVAFDLPALLLRTASVAFTLRALVALVRVAVRFHRDGIASRSALAWSERGIYLVLGTEERWAAREDVLAVALPTEREGRRTVPRSRPLWLITRPTKAPCHWTIPPYFSATAEILAARLERWLGRPEATPASTFEPPRDAPEARYERAARGAIESGELAIPEGFGYRRRAPFTALLGVIFAADALRVAGPMRTRLLPAVALASLLAVGFVLGWFAWMNRRRKTRLGIAILLTREELLVRGRAGVVSIPWGQLSQLELDTRLAWSPFMGSYEVRIFTLTTLDGGQIVLDGDFLGIPPAVFLALCEAYRARAV